MAEEEKITTQNVYAADVPVLVGKFGKPFPEAVRKLMAENERLSQLNARLVQLTNPAVTFDSIEALAASMPDVG